MELAWSSPPPKPPISPPALGPAGKGSGDGQLLRPSGLAVDAEHLYVVDSGNHRVCKFTHGGVFCHAIGG